MEDYREIPSEPTATDDSGGDVLAPRQIQGAKDDEPGRFAVMQTINWKTALVDTRSMSLVFQEAEASTKRRRARTGESPRRASLSVAALGLRLVTLLRALSRKEDAYVSIRTLGNWFSTTRREVHRGAEVARDAGLLHRDDLRLVLDDKQYYRWRVHVMPRPDDNRSDWIPTPAAALLDPRLRHLDIWTLAVLCSHGEYVLKQGDDRRNRTLPPVLTLSRADMETSWCNSGLGRDAWLSSLKRLIGSRYARRQQAGLRLLPPEFRLDEAMELMKSPVALKRGDTMGQPGVEGITLDGDQASAHVLDQASAQVLAR